MSHLPAVLGRRLVRPVLVTAGALALAACSSGGTGAAAAPSAPGTAPAATSAAPATTGTPGPASSSASGGASGGAAGGTTAAAGASAPTAAPDRCATSELAVTLTAGDSGAGQRGATVVLRNTGSRTCNVEGFGGVGLQDAAGRAVPTQQVREDAPAPGLVAVAPGASVRSQLRWTVVPGDGDPAGGCPTPASLAVIPPDEQDALSVAWSLGPVCGGGRLEQQAYVAG